MYLVNSARFFNRFQQLNKFNLLNLLKIPKLRIAKQIETNYNIRITFMLRENL
jgi:hypothetical protein